MTIYDFKVKDAQKNEISMDSYRGKVLLIVNTATGCGFTPQYEALENLYKKYKDEGLEILDFPCNQFLNQAPGTDEEIVEFCQLNYGVSFKTFSKIDVNGSNADPLYTFLKNATPSDKENEETSSFMKVLKDLGQSIIGSNIKWNFTKFLIDRNGNVVGRYSPTYKPENMEARIQELLKS
ncbi:Peroxiredoxin [Ruminiclostridium papyrosolvens DSM 2782]|uniref:Glutathione peroxidase n=1 Tax=Ruminiclostridium papyrosolvens DSM 2782 TaxID=588581 RepID=F1TCS2_9FIRM|nr:glutathione peroxidase [Ruminiclostridium papyrosolvens]EGD47789.1 Peroxiredoxin [Ruminiclostridium papyrosolvens DSM 2782]WES34506.1 glutathione peroxidase [Ruminiclostridium papyrosolvens DSM 2782]